MRKTTGKKQVLILAVIASILVCGIFAQGFAFENKMENADFAFATRNFALSNLNETLNTTNLFAKNLLPATSGFVVEPPKPNFSEMEKWYEIVKYEYGDLATDPTLYFWIKPKTSNAPFVNFCMQFLDKDGVMIDNADPVCGNGIHIDIPVAGQVSKAYVHTPSEVDMEKVASVKVFRVKR